MIPALIAIALALITGGVLWWAWRTDKPASEDENDIWTGGF